MKKLIILLMPVLFAGLTVQAQDVLSPELLWKLKRLSGGKVSPDGNKVLYEIRSFQVETNKGNTDLYVYDLRSNTARQITDTPFSEMEAQWGSDQAIWYLSPESGSIQVWHIEADGSAKKQVSQITEQEIEGFKLAPDGKSAVVIAPMKMKSNIHDKHPDLPLANARIEDDLMYRHWDSWSDDNRRHLFIYSLTNGQFSITYKDMLENEAYDGILPPFGGSDQLAFSPDSKRIIYSCKKKRGKNFALSTNSGLYEYNTETGRTTLLTPDYQGYDASARYSNDGKLLFWLSMARDGFEADKNCLIMRDLASGKDVNLTQKHDITIDDYCLSADLKSVYLLVPYMGSKQLFELSVDKQELKQLTHTEADYLSLELAMDNQLICTRQSMIAPTDLFAVPLKKGKVRQLTDINHNILKNIKLPNIEERWIETSDGKKMLVWVVYPPDFDSNRKYPSILYCQGGPQSMVSQFFSYRWNLALMASQGYIVIAPNRRGLPGFGQQWNDAISKDWGGQAMRDYLAAVDNMSNEPYIDVNRVGAVGASYGGYSVYYLAGIHNGRFKTFISHCGLFNLESWYGTTEELFFANWDNKGPYWLPENKEYYAKNSPHNFVQNWNTPMLVIHGGRDFRVPESEGMQAFQVLQLKGIRSRMLYFPEEGHWVTKPQNGILWYREFFEWLDTDLKK